MAKENNNDLVHQNIILKAEAIYTPEVDIVYKPKYYGTLYHKQSMLT